MDAAAQTISADRMRGVIAEISDDRYGGRLPGTEGDTLARGYLAAELAKIGFAPGAAGGSYEQLFEERLRSLEVGAQVLALGELAMERVTQLECAPPLVLGQ